MSPGRARGVAATWRSLDGLPSSDASSDAPRGVGSHWGEAGEEEEAGPSEGTQTGIL